MSEESKSYTETDWCHDLYAASEAFASFGQASSEALLRYTQERYPGNPEEAEHRAYLLSLAFAFMARHAGDLENAGLMIPNARSCPAEIGEALYRWLVLMPWKGPAPFPDLQSVIRMAKGEQ